MIDIPIYRPQMVLFINLNDQYHIALSTFDMNGILVEETDYIAYHKKKVYDTVDYIAYPLRPI